jgi:hypothetical protein
MLPSSLAAKSTVSIIPQRFPPSEPTFVSSSAKSAGLSVSVGVV